MTESFDLAIVGGGAAGLAAAVRAAASGARVALLERGPLGGRVRHLGRVEVATGHPVGLSGREFAERSVALAQRFGAEVRRVEVAALRVERGSRVLEFAGGSAHADASTLAGAPTLTARAVILAPGAEPPVLAFPGAREFLGSGIDFAIPDRIPESLHAEAVVVMGESRVAAEGALRLCGDCRSVLLLAGPDQLPAELSRRLEGEPRITVRTNTEIIEAAGVEWIEMLLLRDRRSGRSTVRPAAALFALGLDVPRTAWLAGALALDAGGFIVTGPGVRETSIPGVFGAGCARAGAAPGIAGSLDDGIGAAREALEYLRGRAAAGRSGKEPGLVASGRIGTNARLATSRNAE
jgi:thioredoxin reductase (NADPH)